MINLIDSIYGSILLGFILFLIIALLMSSSFWESLSGINRKILGFFVLLPENMTAEQKVKFGIKSESKSKKVYSDKHCKPCGAPLVVGNKKCEYCGVEHKYQSPQYDNLINKAQHYSRIGDYESSADMLRMAQHLIVK